MTNNEISKRLKHVNIPNEFLGMNRLVFIKKIKTLCFGYLSNDKFFYLLYSSCHPNLFCQLRSMFIIKDELDFSKNEQVIATYDPKGEVSTPKLYFKRDKVSGKPKLIGVDIDKGGIIIV